MPWQVRQLRANRRFLVRRQWFGATGSNTTFMSSSGDWKPPLLLLVVARGEVAARFHGLGSLFIEEVACSGCPSALRSWGP